jgi:Zn-dependent peptidase ImmA (M78 family)
VVSSLNDELRELRNHLLTIAERHGIEVEDMPNTPGTHMYVRVFNKIFMNPNETTVTYEFGLAHELSHALYGDPNGEQYYPFSLLFKNAEETAANKNAVRLISDFVYRDTPIEFRNYVNFMESLGLPSYFEDMAREAVMQA